MSRVRFQANLVNGNPFRSEDFRFERGDDLIPLVRIRDIKSTNFETFIDKKDVPNEFLIRDGDLVIGMDGDFNSVIWDRGPAALNQRMCLLRSSDEQTTRFISYAVPHQLKMVNELSYATTVKHLSSQQVLDLWLPDISRRQQHAIADYLDRETTEIDAMTADLDKMEALLTERRGSIVRTHLLPEGKEYTRVKLKAAVSLGKTVQSKQKNAEEVQRNYVRAAHIQPHGRLALDEQPMWFTTSELEQLSLRANDVLVVEGGAGYGRSVVLKEDLPEWGFQNHVIRVRPNPGVVGEFIHYTFLAHYNAGLIDLLADGATIPALSSDKARELPILSVDEHCQRKIVGMVERETAEIDAMLADITELRDLLAERRAALIAAAVTGQIDIPTAEETTHA